MKPSILLSLLGAGACMVLASCESVSDPQQTIRQRNSGYSLDDPPSGQTRYQTDPAGYNSSSPTTTVESSDPSQMPMDSGVATTPAPGVTDPTTPDAPPSPPVPPPPTSTPPPAPAAASSGPPTYGKMVPGRPGFVYPPGVEAKPENMVDVRDFTPGQKVRDPRTGKIFLVP